MTKGKDSRSTWDVIGDAARRNGGILAAAGAVAALAGTALFNRSRAKQAEAETPPAGSFVEVDGVRLHYVERGSGRPLVLLHGNGAMIQDWEASGVLDRAAAHYRVIAFDRPGFGYSDRPRDTVWTPRAQGALLLKTLAALGVAEPIVVGHSWGTLVALAMALEAPDEIAGLVLLSGYYFPTARIDVPLFSPPALPLLGDVMRFTVSPIVGRLATPLMVQTIFAPLPVSESFAAYPVEMGLRPSQIRAAAADTALMVPAAAELSGRYGELLLPVEIVAGDGDLVADYHAQSARLHERVVGSGLTPVDGAGHMVHYAAPDAVMAAIDRVAARALP